MKLAVENQAKAPTSSRGFHVVVVLALTATVGSLDQITKWIVASVLLPGQSLEVIPGLLNLQLRHNPHGAFGLFANLPEQLRLPVLLALSVLAIFAIVTYSIRALGWSVTISVSLGLILGGALSNLADRAFRGEVLDFIDIYSGQAHWPTFNLADMTITIGSLILVGALIKTWVRQSKIARES